jgi:hypothetical protein
MHDTDNISNLHLVLTSISHFFVSSDPFVAAKVSAISIASIVTCDKAV